MREGQAALSDRAAWKLGFSLVGTDAPRRTLVAAGLDVDAVEKGQAVVDLIRRRHCDLVVNTPQGSGARSDGYAIREAALVARVPCITTIAGAAAAVHAIANARVGEPARPSGANRCRSAVP